jgi:TPR repeat protein
MEALAELAIQDREDSKFIPLERGIPYLFKAADAGYLNAQLELARLADRGELSPPEYSKMECDRHREDRQQCDEFNQQQSAHWWKVAADNGSAEAQFRMSDGLIESDDPDEFAEGVKWLTKAARQTTPNPNAQHELACLMESGRIDPGSPGDRWELYEAAAKGGVVEAMLAAGWYLENGIGVERNADAAVEWYLASTKWDDIEGYFFAGRLTGNACHLEKAARQRHVEAMLLLAPRLLDQSLSEQYGFKSFQAGLDHYASAAKEGRVEAVVALAEIYEDGWCNRFPLDWERKYLRHERLEKALTYYEHLRKLLWEGAAENIERIQKELKSYRNEVDQKDLAEAHPVWIDFAGRQVKFYNVANKYWWVPEIAPLLMAVQIRTPQEFLTAIREKILAIAEQTSQEERADLAQITPGAESDPERLVLAGLEQVSLGELIRGANPETGAEAATETEALEAIANQSEVTLADFLA